MEQAMMLGTDSACFWHEPLLLLATCFNKSANNNQKPHVSFLIKPFKNIKNTHDLKKCFKTTSKWYFRNKRLNSKFGWQKIGVLGCNLACSLTGEELEDLWVLSDLLMAMRNFLGQVNLPVLQELLSRLSVLF